MSTHNKITRARTAMIQSARFFGFIALQLQPTEKKNIDTVATDGAHLFYNPVWVEAAPMEQVTAVCAKMALHIALLHHTRRRGRQEKRWKTACDYAANPLIENAEFTLPPEALRNPAFAGKSAEEIYRMLPEDEEGGDGDASEPGEGAGEAGAGPGDESRGDGESAPDPGGCGQVMDAKGQDGAAPSPAELEQIEAETQVKVAQAANLANAAGQGHADLDRLLDNIKQAQVNWIEELRRFMQRSVKTDYTWSRPNRRFASQGIYLPSLRGQGMGEMVVAIDTSGSVVDWLEAFGNELSGIIEDAQPSKVWLLYADDRVAGVEELTVEDMPLVLVAKGYGGTNFCPVYKWVEDNGIEPDCLVYLTDLEGPAPANPPDYPVIWACTGDKKAPWGDLVRLKR